MGELVTSALCSIQEHCKSVVAKTFVDGWAMKMPDTPQETGRWLRTERDLRGWSAQEVANRVNGLLLAQGDPKPVSQQVVSNFEQGKTKAWPTWTRVLPAIFEAAADEMAEDPKPSFAYVDSVVAVRRLPMFVGLGAGGLEDLDEYDVVSFSRDLVERELRAPPDALLAMIAEGNSMEPDFRGGDQILVDTRRRSLAQPGAFCLWDGDGFVVKFLERVHGSEPAKVRVISANSEVYGPHERLVEEINLIGRVVWYGRRVQ